ncbi:MAG: hypothetical protein ACI8VE_002684 [Natrialbaceae archaeon]|jgi:hypothetical protein
MPRSSFRIPDGREVPAVTTDEMREVDRVAVEDVGLELLQMRACHRIVLMVVHVLGAGSPETVEPVPTAPVRPELRDGR